MEKKSQDFSVQELQRLAKSPAGQQLYRLLQQQDSAQLQQAMKLASAGNYAEAGKQLQSALSSPEAQRLIRQLGGQDG